MPDSLGNWTEEDYRGRQAWIDKIRALPRNAIVRARPMPDCPVLFRGTNITFPRGFTCTVGELEGYRVEVVGIVDPNPAPPDAPTLAQRVTRGRGLNRMLDDTAGLDRS